MEWPSAPVLDALYRLIGHPLVGYAAAIVIAVISMWLIARMGDQRHKTLVEGNKTLEQIQANMAVDTAHNAANVEAQRAIVTHLERIADRLHDHDRDEASRHAETMRAFRERPK